MVKDHSDSERGNPMSPLHGLTTRVLLYAPSDRQESTYHGLCYTSAVAGTTYVKRGIPGEEITFLHHSYVFEKTMEA